MVSSTKHRCLVQDGNRRPIPYPRPRPGDGRRKDRTRNQLAGRELSIQRAGRVAGHELAGCELASSLARRSRASQMAGRELTGCELARPRAQGASSPGRELA
ncbi:UNVERIFIED_CONTAM: hypothetical protein Slati_4412100 [Sesamum latifolium]|uniref:Uncharacterized protein n=1 Tax=Sesamum latifolium TaxID=2727402 RepID=A0AAW2SQP4_9LAMI